jgi:hypothetical protein
MAEFFNALKISTEFFISFGLVIMIVLIFSSVGLREVQKTSRKRILVLFIIGLVLSIVLSALAIIAYILVTRASFVNFNLYLLFTLVFSVNLNLSLAINIRKEISRAKKTMSFDESVVESIRENSKKVLDVIIYYFLFLLTTLFLVNNEVASFVVTLFIPIIVCSCISAFASNTICKASERIIK